MPNVSMFGVIPSPEGAWDMVRSMEKGIPAEAGKELALHVLEVMEAMAESSRSGSFARLQNAI